MATVSHEFVQFVNCVEAQTPFKKQKFKSVKELQVCMKYFFERAVTKPHLSRRYATAADTLKLVVPESEKYPSLLNLRKILVTVARSEIDEVFEMMNCASSVRKDRARGSFKFFGELFNIGFIFIKILRTAVEMLDDSKHDSEISMECLKLLLETVETKMLGMPDDYSGDFKYMKEILKKPKRSLEKSKPAPQSNLLKTAEQFPDLMGSSWSLDGSFSKELSAEKKVEAFAAIVKKLTTDNCVAVIKKIETQNKGLFDNESWQSYYDVLISEALSKPNNAEHIVVLCQKLPKLGSAWNAVKKEDYQKYIFYIIAQKIEAGPTQLQENAIITLFKALVNKSLCSIGNIAFVLVATIKYSDKNMSAAANILCKIVEIIKGKFNEAKIQRMPQGTRRLVIQIIGTKKINEDKFALLKSYLLGDEQSEESSDEDDNDLCDVIAGVPSGTEGVSNSHKQAVKKASFSVITKFFDDVATQDLERLKLTIQSSVKEDNWDLTKVAKELLDRTLNSKEDKGQFFQVALVINSEVGGEGFEKNLSEIAIKRFRESLALESLDALTAIAGFLCKLYTFGWISGKSFLDCVELAASDGFATYERVMIVKDLIKPVVAKLQTECFVDRFTYYFQLLRKRVNEDKLLHRDEYLELIDLLKSLSAVVEIVEDKDPTTKFTSEDKKKIALLIDGYVKENSESKLVVIASQVNNNTEKIDFLANYIVNNLLDYEVIPMYVSMAKQLTELLNSGDQSEQFGAYISNACYRVIANVLVDAKIPDSKYKWTPTFLGFSCELYKLKILKQVFIANCLDTFFKADKSCEKSVQCIVQIITAIGQQYEEENPKAVKQHFSYFDWLIRGPIDSSDDVRGLEFKKLIEFRRNGWKAVPKKPESVILNDNLKSGTLIDPTSSCTQLDPITPEEEIQENKENVTTLTISYDEMSSDQNLSAIVVDIRKVLTSENHIKTFIKASLIRPSIDQRNISIQTTLLRKLSESFSNDTEIDFADFLIETMNSELARTNALRCFDESSKLEFTRLMIMSGELFRQNLLSADDFAPWLFHKHVNQVPGPILCGLVESIRPKIQSGGTKQLKLALIILESTIHTATMDMSASIKFDIGEMGRELHYHRKKSLNGPVPPVFMMPSQNWFAGHPLTYMRGGSKP